MPNRIILCGASSVGKSTLATEWCQVHKDYARIDEIARDIMKNLNITRVDLRESLLTQNKTVFLQLQRQIIKEQSRRELLLEKKSCFISDRGIFDALTFAYYYASKKDAMTIIQEEEVIRTCIRRYQMQYLVAVLCPLPTVTDDNFRMTLNGTEEQHKFNDIMCELLHDNRIPYIYIDEIDRRKRLNILEKCVKGEYPFNAEQYSKSITSLNIPFLLECLKLQQRIYLRNLLFTMNTMTVFYSVYSPGKSNRMIQRYGESKLVRVEFNALIPSQIVEQLLTTGIYINGEEYQFLGCSSSGLKERHCYMLKGSTTDVENVLLDCGHFSIIKSVSKQLKRIGMLYSEAISTGVIVSDHDVVEIQDIETPSGNFTDGCGFINTNLARKVIAGANIELNNANFNLPSVYQIRYQGCKGIVIIDPDLNDSQLVIRKSMKKFNPGRRAFPEIWLCDYSRPYTFGHLNKQYIMLLSGLGIKDDVLLKKFNDYIVLLEKMQHNPDIAAKLLWWNNQDELAYKVASYENALSFRSDAYLQKELLKFKSRCIAKIEKLNFLIPKSRNVFGVCDPLGVLRYGECFFRPTISGEAKTLRGKVIVSKNPCYLLGDVRLLNAVDDDRVAGLKHLVDCIVFPIKGKRPHCAEIAGSDLDGDQYFVCWDKDLIVPQLRLPYTYPEVTTICKNSDVTQQDRIKFFSQQTKFTMARINKFYNYWADVRGTVDCDECISLGQLFSRSVDASKTGDIVRISPLLRMQKTLSSSMNDQCQVNNDPSTEKRVAVWKEMERLAIEKKRQLTTQLVDTVIEIDDNASLSSTDAAISEDFLWSVIEDKELTISEFKLFQFIQRWCYAHDWSHEMAAEKLLQFADHLNFGEFTTCQQIFAIDAGIPKQIVTNGLNKSQLLPFEEIKQFSLELAYREWKFYFRSEGLQFDWLYLLRAICHHPESMIIFELDSGFTVTLHFLSPMSYGESKICAGTVICYFFSSHFAYHFRHVLNDKYSINLDDEILQLYRNGRKNQTFIWLKRETNGEHKHLINILPVADRISVDITTFKRDIIVKGHPKVNKLQVRRIEVFVKSASNEPVVFDTHEVDQYDLTTQIITEEIEDIESEEENNVGIQFDEVLTSTITLEPYTLDAALSNLLQFSNDANVSQFLCALQIICEKERNNLSRLDYIYKQTLQLLTEVVNRHVQKLLPSNVVRDLEQIVLSLLPKMVSPFDSLKILHKLSLLQCNFIVQHVTTSVLGKIQLCTITDYMQLLSNWKLWFVLPWSVAYQIMTQLYASALSLTSEDGIDLQIENQIENMSITNTWNENQNENGTCPISNQQRNRYVCYFGHLLLLHFLVEIKNIQDQMGKDNEEQSVNCIKLLKAYDYKDPHCSEDNNNQKEIGDGNVEDIVKIGFYGNNGVVPKKFTCGTWVSIYAMKRARRIAFGRIAMVPKCPIGADICVEVEQPIPDCLQKSTSLKKGHWELRMIGNVTTFSRAMSALTALQKKKTSSHVIPLLIQAGVFPPIQKESYSSASNLCTTIHETAYITDVDNSYNPSQQEAIKAAMARKLTLIHGPPGTGKTHVACEIIRRMCNNLDGRPGNCVLVAAETNMAVDNLTRRLLDLQLTVVRVGNLASVSSHIRCASLEYQVNNTADQAGKKKRFLDTKIARKILNAAQVVTTTCAGAGDALLTKLNFQYVVIDEATQVIEPVCLIPLVHDCQQLVLIGDPEQLSPTLAGTGDETMADVDVNVKELAVTLFHRLSRIMPSYFLEEQYRMHPSICEFPSRTFYEHKLISSNSVKERLPLGIRWIDKNRPLLFVDVSFREKKVVSSWKNEEESNLIKLIVRNLLNSEIAASDITVLTPYNGQVRCIKEALALITKHVQVSTVDGFQGRENDVVIFSTVRSNSRGDLGFTDDRYRMNVLLTRAKRLLIGVGCKNTLCNSQLWNLWLKEVPIITKQDVIVLIGENSDNINRQNKLHMQRKNEFNNRRRTRRRGFSARDD